jgi:AraC-like DNA-binding protein
MLPIIDSAGDLTVKAGWKLGPRKISNYEIVFFPVGTNTRYWTERQTYTLKEPCFIISRPGEPHAYEFDPNHPTRHLFIHFSFPENAPAEPSLPMLHEGGIDRLSADHCLCGPALMSHIFQLIHETPARWEQRAGSLLWSVLEELQGIAVQPPETKKEAELPLQIRETIEYMEEHLHENVSVEQLARMSGWSREHFSRSFLLHVGKSPRDMLHSLRMERACQLLLQKEWSVKEIAFAVGLANVHYFYRAFKRFTGYTANSYRKKFSNPRMRNVVPVSSLKAPYPLNVQLVKRKNIT